MYYMSCICIYPLIASDDASVESVGVTADTGKKFTGGKKKLTLERVKVSGIRLSDI